MNFTYVFLSCTVSMLGCILWWVFCWEVVKVFISFFRVVLLHVFFGPGSWSKFRIRLHNTVRNLSEPFAGKRCLKISINSNLYSIARKVSTTRTLISSVPDPPLTFYADAEPGIPFHWIADISSLAFKMLTKRVHMFNGSGTLQVSCANVRWLSFSKK